MSFQETNCPLCNGKAKYKGCDHEKFYYYVCPNCKEFCIYDGAKDILLSDSNESKLKLANDSKNNTNKEILLVIELRPNTTRSASILYTEFQNRNLLKQCS
jgi:hypothetical protein